MQQLDTIADGFSYSLIQRRSVNSQWSASLGSLDTLRRSKGYVPKIYTVPIQWAAPTTLRNTIQQQVHMFPGSYIWSITNSYSAPVNNGNTPATNYYLYIRDEGAGIELFSGSFLSYHFFRGNAFPGPGGVSQPDVIRAYTDRIPNPYQVNPLLTQPYLVSGSGLITVQVSQVTQNVGALPFGFQFVFSCAVPRNPLSEVQING